MRQQGGEGIMIWAGIIYDIMVGPWRDSEGTQIAAEKYTALLKEHQEPWFKRQRITFRKTMMFMQDNAASAGFLGGRLGNCLWAPRSGGPLQVCNWQVWTVSHSHTGHNRNIVTHHALAALPFNLPKRQIKWQ